MTKKELIELLKNIPDETNICTQLFIPNVHLSGLIYSDIKRVIQLNDDTYALSLE